MKVWQLLACLGHEDHIRNKYFKGIDIIARGKDELDESIVISALSESTTKLYRNGDWLRLFGNNNDPISQLYTILEAYNEFGGNAITEVFDYGCVQVKLDV